LGTHLLNFDNPTKADDMAALRAALLPLRRSRVAVLPALRPIYAVPKHPELFFRIELLDALAEAYPNNWMYADLAAFGRAIEYDPRRIMPAKVDRRPFVPLNLRQPRPDGKTPRGPDWAPYEDEILAKYFSADPHTGKRKLLDDAMWTMLLVGDLKNRRTRRSVLARVSVLNMQLKRSLMVDGVLNDDGVRRYVRQKLGQRTRVPLHRPRLNGEYRISRRKHIVGAPRIDEDDDVPASPPLFHPPLHDGKE
jgi:hypothetical protein